MTDDEARDLWVSSSPRIRAEKFRYAPSASIINRDWDSLSELQRSWVRRALVVKRKKEEEESKRKKK